MLHASSKYQYPTEESSSQSFAEDRDWHTQEEGQLAIDVAETDSDILVISALAGAESRSIEVSVHNDLLTIRGIRTEPHDNDIVRYFHKECFWGAFSRTIVLPVEVAGDKAIAHYASGILTVRIPKMVREKKIPIFIVEE
ncbi:MAG: Hsp20/alpha crystallin family protein [Candidatus Magasanikbacteria bacterium]|jgi:HSP20 family protein|nr:Hsp20/alpha crystallin family protein [Candidatus Magasanikbacteria bacterium]